MTEQVKYDVIGVLGYGFSKDWRLPNHVEKRLKKAAELYRSGLAPKIVVCGKWSLAWDQQGITPPTTEAEEMKKVLMELGVEERNILKEEDSKDTVGNALYLKTRVMRPNGYKTALVLCADYVAGRVSYIFGKVFEDPNSFTLLPTETQYKDDPEMRRAQEENLELQKGFLGNMKPGDDSFLEQRLYGDPYYTEGQKNVPEKVRKAALGSEA